MEEYSVIEAMARRVRDGTAGPAQVRRITSLIEAAVAANARGWRSGQLDQFAKIHPFPVLEPFQLTSGQLCRLVLVADELEDT